MTQYAMGATYTPRSFFITGSFSFDVISPGELNALTQDTASLPGLIGGRLNIERGLYGPDWSHWIELDYFRGSSEASTEAGTYSHSISYLAVIPIGVTYWFLRSAFIDFGLSAGGGVGFAPSYSLTSGSADQSGTPTSQAYVGKLGPVGVARVQARFFLSKSFAATFATGLHVFSSPLATDGPPAATVQAGLTGLSLMGGVTYALGGVQGTGRSYVEVIRDKPDARPAAPIKAPAPAPSARPQSAAPPKPGR